MQDAEKDLIVLEDDPKYLRHLTKIHHAFILSAHASLVGQSKSHKTSAKCKAISSRYVELIESFQQDPQLLDRVLKQHLSDLNALYLKLVTSELFLVGDHEVRAVLDCTSVVLYYFCKVRGDKVISRFLSNEPQYLDCVVNAYNLQFNQTDEQATNATAWQHLYLLLVWIAHLILVPFGLDTLSDQVDTSALLSYGLVNLPAVLPKLALQCIQIAVQSISSSSKVQKPASALLASISLRPDMRQHDILSAIVRWSTTRIQQNHDAHDNLHENIGMLHLLSSVVKQGNVQQLAEHFEPIYTTIGSIFGADCRFSVLCESSVAKRLAIKIERNILLQLLRHQQHRETLVESSLQHLLNDLSLDEAIIDFLLSCLSDRESKTRTAAAKALSLITARIEVELAVEIVSSIIESLEEDVLTHDDSRDFSAVSAPKWHGLVMTLSLMLFHRSPTPSQLPRILDALFSALQFEQRSANGAFLGTSIRDAANIGLWSLVRRYSTSELLEAGQSGISTLPAMRRLSQDSYSSIFENLAVNLLITACLDSVGNVRRGSSAAFQELVGRHPNTVPGAIALVQVVDYQAVSLKQRAISDIAVQVCKTSPAWTRTFLYHLRGWRGTGSSDTLTRDAAATAIGRISVMLSSEELRHLIAVNFDSISGNFSYDKHRIHGVLLTLASILDKERIRERIKGPDAEYWSLKSWTMRIVQSSDHIQSQGRLSIELQGLLKLILAQGILLKSLYWSSSSDSEIGEKEAKNLLRPLLGCIQGSNEDMCHEIEQCSGILADLLSMESIEEALQTLSSCLGDTCVAVRTFGPMIACGTMLRALVSQQVTVSKHSTFLALLRKAAVDADIESRVKATAALTILTRTPLIDTESALLVLRVINTGLNDYTITERGDVGSLLRIQAMRSLKEVYHVLQDRQALGKDLAQCCICVFRLALEKLDVVRVYAHDCLQRLQLMGPESFPFPESTDVSSIEYFKSYMHVFGRPIALAAMGKATAATEQWFAIIDGLASTISGGNDASSAASRNALHDMLQSLPVSITESKSGYIGADLETFGYVLLALLGTHHGNDRRVVPLLDMMAFVLDAGLFQGLESGDFRWKQLLVCVQRCHFKTTNIGKVSAALKVYRSLLDVRAIRQDVLKKMCELLRHVFPKIRVETAEILYFHTADKLLEGRDWTAPPKNNKTTVDLLTKKLCHTGI